MPGKPTVARLSGELQNTPVRTDPIIVKISEQRKLLQSWTAVIDTNDDESTAACAAYNAAFKRLMRTKPRTRTGAVALVRYCLDDACFPGAPDVDDALALLRTLAKAIPALA